MNIINFICSLTIKYTDGSDDVFGNGILFKRNCILTAKHILEHHFEEEVEVDSISVEHLDKKYDIDNFEIWSTDNYAFIKFVELINNLPDFNEKVFNTSFSIKTNTPLPWEAHGYLEENRRYNPVYGYYCQPGHDKNTYFIYDIKNTHSTYSSMSGSPVIINDMIVGLLQEQKTLQNIPNALNFTTFDEIKDSLKSEMTFKGIYNNIHFEKNDYRSLIEEDLVPYISRRIRKYNENAIFAEHTTLIELLTSESDKKQFIVILGEAGSGKTIELKQLAAELFDEKYLLYPVYAQLKSTIAKMEFEDIFPEYTKYLLNGVPVCLILDGYDEISDEKFRDDTLPKILSQHIQKLKAEYPDQRINIVISSRRNYFYKNRFTDFTPMEILPLSNQDINHVLENYHIDIYEFWTKVNERALNTIIENPFYFKHILFLYQNNDCLPKKSELMETIITQLMKKNHEKLSGYLKGITTANKGSIRFLRSIAAASVLYGQDFFSDDDYAYLTAGKIDEVQNTLVKCTGIFEDDNEGRCFFTHNNFREYLAAEFFNERYNDNIEGLIKIIARPDHQGIQSRFYNMVTYLLSIRKSNDLINWIAENCIGDFELFIDELDDERKFELFQTIFLVYNSKCQIFYPSACERLGNIINNEKRVNYLLNNIESSTNDSILFNSLRILQNADLPFWCKNDVKRKITSFLQSGKGDENHVRDSICVFAYQNINDDDVIDFLHDKYLESQNEQILRGIYIFVEKLQLSDKFVDYLIKGLVLHEKWDSYPYSIIDSIKKLKQETSFVKFLNFLRCVKYNDNHRIKKEIQEIFEDNDFIASLIEVYRNGDQQVILELAVEASCNLVGDLFIDRNLFSDFFNQTKTASEVLLRYLIKYKNNGVVFQRLSYRLSGYYNFLKYHYQKHDFDDCIDLFNYCIREIPQNNNEKHLFITLIEDCGFSTSKNTIQYVEYDKHYRMQQEENSRLFVEYVFDFELYKSDMYKYLEENKLIDSTKHEVWNYMIQNHSWGDKQMLLGKMLMNFCPRNGSAIEYLEKYSSNDVLQNFWIVLNLDKTSQTNIHFIDLISNEQLVKVKSICKSLLHDFNPEKSIDYNRNFWDDKLKIKNVISLVRKLKFEIDISDLAKLVYVPEFLYCSDSEEYKRGFSEWLIEKLGKNKLLEQIEYYRCNGLIQGEFLEKCLHYFLMENDQVNDYFVELAFENITSVDSTSDKYYSWKYLIEHNQQDGIVYFINAGKIDYTSFFNYLHLLNSYENDYLKSYTAHLFDHMYKYYESNDENNAVVEFPFLSNYYSNTDVMYNLKCCIRILLSYQIYKGSDIHINLYLDQIIEEKKYSPFESSGFNLLICCVDSPMYIEKLVEILKLVTEDNFSEDKFNRMNMVIEKLLIKVGCKDPEKMFEALKPYQKSSDNELLCRLSNDIADEIRIKVAEKKNKKYEISEIKQFVFYSNY